VKTLALFAATVTALTALPATAQSGIPTVADAYDAGDWWWLDTTGKGAGAAVMLVDGEGKRRGKRVELNSFLIDRSPDPNGPAGSMFTHFIDCKARTRRTILRTFFYADMRMTSLPAVDMGKVSMAADAPIYRFACTADRPFATHFGPGSRRAVAEAIFAKYPK
jgi:hypothetical protein